MLRNLLWIVACYFLTHSAVFAEASKPASATAKPAPEATKPAAELSLADKNLAAGQAFLEENKKNPGVHVLPSGLQYKIIKEGEGTPPDPTDFVVVNYRGTLIDGTEFDSSYAHNIPITLAVNATIPGWVEALPLMKPGSKWTLYIPPHLAYGKEGAGRLIGPNTTLIFDVELISVKPTLDSKHDSTDPEIIEDE